MKQTVVVIGGGASGSAAAYTLKQKGYKVIVIEKDNRLGGRICSIKLGEQSFEMGAGFVMSGLYPNTFKLLEATNLSDDLSRRKSNGAIVRDGKLRNAKSLLGGGWLPLGAKLLAVKQVLKVGLYWRLLSLKRMEDAAQFDSHSVTEELRGRAGNNLLEYLIQPLLSSYLYWRPEQTSQAMLMVLTKASFRKGRTYTMKHGLQQIPETLTKGCTVVLGAEAVSVKQNKDGQYEIGVKDSKRILADGVVCATIASVALEIVKDLSAKQEAFLLGVAYSKTIVVANAYAQLGDLPNYELAYPRAESNPMTAITMQTIQDGNRGYERVVKSFASGQDAEELLTMNDDEVRKQLVLTSLAFRHVGSDKTPHSSFIKRWHEALPVFSVGYLRHLKSFKEHEGRSNECLVLAGDYIGGPYIEGAITSGIEAAERLSSRLNP